MKPTPMLLAAPSPACVEASVRAQRKSVYVQGCVRDRKQVGRIIAAIKGDPRVEYVGDALRVGDRGKPPYRTAHSN